MKSASLELALDPQILLVIIAKPIVIFVKILPTYAHNLLSTWT